MTTLVLEHLQHADSASPDITIDSSGRVGIGTSSPTSILHVKGRTLAVDGAAASDSPRLNLDLDGTNKASVLLNRVTEDLQLTVVGSNDMTFTTNAAERMRIDSTGHLKLNPINSFTGLNNSLLGSSNGYMYAMGGTAGLYLADNANLHNAIGIRDANYIDFTTGGVSTHKFDTAGIHFQRADGQSITAKESLILTVDADNNTASRVFQVSHGNGKQLLLCHDDYRTEVGTLLYSSVRSAGAGATGSFSASAGDWVDVAVVPYGRNIATIKLFWDGVHAPGSAHHGNMEFDIQSHYGTSYYYGWDSSITLKNSSAHNSFYISEARIITPNGSGATGHFQVKFGVAVSTGLFRSYSTTRDEACSIYPMNPTVNNSRSGTTIARVLLDNRPSFATSRDLNVIGKIRAQGQPSFSAHKTSHLVLSGAGSAEAGTWDENWMSGAHNTGGHFNTTTGRFTAPVAGKYKFDANIMHGITNGDFQIWLCVNGNTSTCVRSNSMQSTGGNWKQTTVTGIFNLAASDYISIFVRSSAAEPYAMYGSSTGAFTTCNGYLIG